MILDAEEAQQLGPASIGCWWFGRKRRGHTTGLSYNRIGAQVSSVDPTPRLRGDADKERPMIVALAGRRPDALDGPPRFPRENVLLVRQRVRRMLRECVPHTLVTSAACGADLIALEEAIALHVHCRVILPFSAEQFRSSSVVDRGAEWGEVYDWVLARVESFATSFRTTLEEMRRTSPPVERLWRRQRDSGKRMSRRSSRR